MSRAVHLAGACDCCDFAERDSEAYDFAVELTDAVDERVAESLDVLFPGWLQAVQTRLIEKRIDEVSR